MKTLEEKIAVMQAAADGKQIQYYSGIYNEWEDVHWMDSLVWNWLDCDYRVKPEEPKCECVPYSMDDFLGDQREHGPYLFLNGCLMLPIFIDNKGIELQNDKGNHYWSYGDLNRDYTRIVWQDGTRCGRLKVKSD